MKVKDIIKYRKEIEMLEPERHVLIIYNDGSFEIFEWGDGSKICPPKDFSFENVFALIHRHYDDQDVLSQADLVMSGIHGIYVGVICGKKLKIAKATVMRVELPYGRGGWCIDKVIEAYEYDFKTNKWRKLRKEEEIYYVIKIKIKIGGSRLSFLKRLFRRRKGKVSKKFLSKLSKIISERARQRQHQNA